MTKIIFQFAISMAPILFILTALSFGIGQTKAECSKGKEFNQWKVTCNQDRTQCFDVEMEPKDASASASKPAKRYAALGKKNLGGTSTVVVGNEKLGGDGQFFEDTFKTWFNPPEGGEEKPTTSAVSGAPDGNGTTQSGMPSNITKIAEVSTTELITTSTTTGPTTTTLMEMTFLEGIFTVYGNW